MVEMQLMVGLEEAKQQIRAALTRLGSSVEVAGKVERTVGEEGLYVVVLEKYYLRVDSYASLTVVASGDAASTQVTAIASGAGGGLLNVGFGAKGDLERTFAEEMKSFAQQ